MNFHIIRFGSGATASKYPFNGDVSHSDELIYLFPYPPYAANLNANDTEMAKNMVDLWTSFVRNGIPSLSFVWPPLTSIVTFIIKNSFDFKSINSANTVCLSLNRHKLDALCVYV